MSVPERKDPLPVPAHSTGRTLAAKREEWGLTVEDAAGYLNLTPDTIAALEADEYAKLPGTTFIKGYIRSYAKLLQLDVEDLMQHIDLQPERITEIPSSRAALKQKGKIRTRDKNSSVGRVLRVLLLLLIIGGLGLAVVTQLSKPGISNVFDLVDRFTNKEPAPADSSQIVIPDSSGGDQSTQKDALIRIE